MVAASVPSPTPVLVAFARLLDCYRYSDQEWRRDAACRGRDPDWFHPPRGASSRGQLRVCAGCPVRAECLQHALDHCEKFGIWGGTSEKQRRRARRRGWDSARLLEELG